MAQTECGVVDEKSHDIAATCGACAAFSADPALANFELQPVRGRDELATFIQRTRASGRIFVGIAGLGVTGPRTALAEAVAGCINSDAIASIGQAYVAYFDERLTSELQRSGVFHPAPPAN